LATVVDSNWLKNYRGAFDVTVEQLPWWLGPELEAAAHRAVEEATVSLPSAAYWKIVRTIKTWMARRPQLVSTSPLAADPGKEETCPKIRTFQWKSPDGRYVAELSLPATYRSSEENVSRILYLWHGDEPATKYAETWIRLGTVHQKTDTNSQLELTLAELREGCDGRLFVGENAEEWSLELQRGE
jgi:hypothetical protein